MKGLLEGFVVSLEFLEFLHCHTHFGLFRAVLYLGVVSFVALFATTSKLYATVLFNKKIHFFLPSFCGHE